MVRIDHICSQKKIDFWRHKTVIRRLSDYIFAEQPLLKDIMRYFNFSQPVQLVFDQASCLTSKEFGHFLRYRNVKHLQNSGVLSEMANTGMINSCLEWSKKRKDQLKLYFQTVELIGLKLEETRDTAAGKHQQNSKTNKHNNQGQNKKYHDVKHKTSLDFDEAYYLR